MPTPELYAAPAAGDRRLGLCYTPPKTRTPDLIERIRELRIAGSSPKEIARAVGARPAEVTAIVRDLAREAAAGEPEIVGCWVSRDWSSGLTVDGVPEPLLRRHPAR